MFGVSLVLREAKVKERNVGVKGSLISPGADGLSSFMSPECRDKIKHDIVFSCLELAKSQLHR
jgi:hypothetical protein